MYVPPLEAIIRHTHLRHEQLSKEGQVQIPASLLRFLLQIAVSVSHFNEEGYLRANPDVEEAVRKGRITSAKLHYIGDGYLEGRLGAAAAVDEAWYLHTYPDVAAAVRSRSVSSATEHFRSVGALELRAPSAAYEPDAVEWGKALGR